MKTSKQERKKSEIYIVGNFDLKFDQQTHGIRLRAKFRLGLFCRPLAAKTPIFCLLWTWEWCRQLAGEKYNGLPYFIGRP